MTATTYIVVIATVACAASVARLVVAILAYRITRAEVKKDGHLIVQGSELE